MQTTVYEMFELLGSRIYDDRAFGRVRGFLAVSVDYYPPAALVIRDSVSKSTKIKYLHDDC